jgi:cytochrome c oxidase subunit 3
MSTVAIAQSEYSWVQPSKGRVAMFCFIFVESTIFTIFVVAYLYNIGRSLHGPTPKQVLSAPVFNTICLLSSSLTIWFSERAIEKGKIKAFGFFWFLTFALGAIFLAGTSVEWHKLIYEDGLTLGTNLFGTTYYSLVGLHATHVVLGLLALLIVLLLSVTGRVRREHAERIQVLALYWHFVDAVWVVVFSVVYILGR